MRYIILQLILFIPFYLIWRKDCKTIGKDKLLLRLWTKARMELVNITIKSVQERRENNV